MNMEIGSPAVTPFHSPALASRRGIGKYPPLSHPRGRAPPLPRERQLIGYLPFGAMGGPGSRRPTG